MNEPTILVIVGAQQCSPRMGCMSIVLVGTLETLSPPEMIPPTPYTFKHLFCASTRS